MSLGNGIADYEILKKHKKSAKRTHFIHENEVVNDFGSYINTLSTSIAQLKHIAATKSRATDPRLHTQSLLEPSGYLSTESIHRHRSVLGRSLQQSPFHISSTEQQRLGASGMIKTPNHSGMLKTRPCVELPQLMLLSSSSRSQAQKFVQPE